MPASNVTICTTEDPRVANQLELSLLEELRSTSEQSENKQITLELLDNSGVLIGGLVGSTSYGWLLIKVLWVAAQSRKNGHGRGLVERAIDQARAIGCHSVWLDTSDLSALHFYRSLGFEEFGVLKNGTGYFPDHHCRHFLKKHI